jgi:CubicO group peptidase (beta-lactamase class C family)
MASYDGKVIFEQETGTKIFEEFKRQVADPIGMQDFDINNCFYQYESEISMHPAYPFRISARDMLRYGILYQKNGNWNGNQIIPEIWIEESTTVYSIVDTTAGIGYGYLWDVIPKESELAQIAENNKIFFHTGIGVHLLMIIPGLKLVLVMRMDTDGEWTDPGEDTSNLALMILTARTI